MVISHVSSETMNSRLLKLLLDHPRNNDRMRAQVKDVAIEGVDATVVADGPVYIYIYIHMY